MQNLDDELRALDCMVEYRRQRGLTGGIRTRLKECKLAIRCGGRFDFVEKKKNAKRY
jgi:hypothetical protein